MTYFNNSKITTHLISTAKFRGEKACSRHPKITTSGKQRFFKYLLSLNNPEPGTTSDFSIQKREKELGEQGGKILSKLNRQVQLQNIIDNNSLHIQRLTAFK